MINNIMVKLNIYIGITERKKKKIERQRRGAGRQIEKEEHRKCVSIMIVVAL